MRKRFVGRITLLILARALAGKGGEVVAMGTPQQLAQHPASVTGRYLSNGWHQRAADHQRALDGRSWLTLTERVSIISSTLRHAFRSRRLSP